MSNFDFKQMQQIQKELQEKYKDKWTKLSPDAGQEKLLWMLIEAGEIADVLKKNGNDKIMEDSKVRQDFIEEMCDTLMYLNDIMICYDITPEELEEVYLNKHKRNMNRWYTEPNKVE